MIAPDSFKESMSAAEAAAAMAAGVRSVLPDAHCIQVPMADGGEGTVDAAMRTRGGRRLGVVARDQLGRPVRAEIGLTGTGAVIEAAGAVGLALVPPGDRDLLRGSTAGVADLIRAALAAGADHLLIGLGGSGTNDGGAGLLVGLGARLLDAAGRIVPPEPGRLAAVETVDLSGLDPRLAGTTITLACDVANPLLGPDGATAVFGPQKLPVPGETVPDQTLAIAEAGLARFADALERAIGVSVRDEPGAGAAGGLGFALLAVGAVRRSGVDTVIDAVGLDDLIRGADLVLTGEGSLDRQTPAGKTPAGVAAVARRHRVPVIALAGRIEAAATPLLEAVFDAVVPILRAPGPLPEALAAGPDNLRQAAATTVRLLTFGRASD